MNELGKQILKDGRQISDKDRILRRLRVINGQQVEHTVYHIPGNDIMLLYNVRVDGNVAMSIPFIADNVEYAEQAYKLMNGLFTPNKLSKNRLRKHDYVNRKGKIDIYETITQPKVM